MTAEKIVLVVISEITHAGVLDLLTQRARLRAQRVDRRYSRRGALRQNDLCSSVQQRSIAPLIQEFGLHVALPE